MKPSFAGRKLGYTFDNKNFHNVSLGQGQEVEAEKALDLAAQEGHWVILQVKTDTLIFELTFCIHGWLWSCIVDFLFPFLIAVTLRLADPQQPRHGN